MQQKTPLYDLHVKLGGTMVDFAGFLLPVQYGNGILHEHKVVRENAGLFDVSHMGEVFISGANATAAVQHLVSNTVATMQIGQCRYALLCYENGTIVDDLLIYRFAENEYFLVVNASNASKDFAWMQAHLLPGASIKDLSAETAEIALQGPKAHDVLAQLVAGKDIPEKNYHFVRNVLVGETECLLSSTGYTGERGFEFYCAPSKAVNLYETLLEAGKPFGVEPAGLGARDTLRFEASMPLYGHELSDQTFANEVGLDVFVKMNEAFIGRDALLGHKSEFQRVGLKLLDRGIARAGEDIFTGKGENVGRVTSGGPAPTLGASYAMARVRTGLPNEPLLIDIRGRKVKAAFTPMPFYKRQERV